MSQSYTDPYDVLGLAREATAAEIKQAYFALVRAHPPERDPQAFKRIRAAYERLRDPETRAEANMLLLDVWPAATSRRQPLELDLTLHRDDVIEIARALSDLARTDWREHYGKVDL